MKRLWLIGLVLVMAWVATLPAAAQEDGGPGDRVLISMQYPSVDGSSSTEPLQKVIACHIYDVEWLWAVNSYDLTYYVVAGLRPDQVGDLGRERGAEIANFIQHSSTHDSYMYLIEGYRDFILVARAPSRDELQAASEAGVDLDVQPVALDAFVFLANVENPAESVTVDDMRSVYTGVITSWNDLGVAEAIVSKPANPITPYTRNPNSGSQELMERLVMQSAPMIDARHLMEVTMIGPITAVSRDPLGLGYSVFFYASYILPEANVKLLGVDGVIPTSATIADGSYPLVTEVYAVVREDMPADSTAVLLRDWLLTPEGQAAIAASGYVPLLPK